MSFIPVIMEYQAQRTATIRMQIRLENQRRALMRRHLGWRWDMPEKEREQINKRAAKLVSEIIEGLEGHPLRAFVLHSQMALVPLNEHKKECERQMVALAKQLPVDGLVDRMPGFGYLGLAIIVGEAGDIARYPNPAKLWKRFGVFPHKRVKGESAGYSPRRRSALWTLGDSAIKAKGWLRDLYLERKAYIEQREPEWTKMHWHRWAQMAMEKRLLLELWRAWHHVIAVPQAGSVPEPVTAHS